MRVFPRIPAFLSFKGKREEAEHIERRHPRPGKTDEPEDDVSTRECPPEDLILAEKTGQRRDACDGNRGNQERAERRRKRLFQSSHLPDVLFLMHRMNDGPRAQKKERLEESVGHNVKDAGTECPDAEGQEHVSQLADGGIREHFLDVVLNEADRGGKERR
jgi:hypothetical protein